MFSRIQQSIDDLSKAERRAAEWILAHPHAAAEVTLADLSKESGVSEPTVIRLARRLGLDGFRELSRRLTEALSRPQEQPHRDVHPGDSAGEAANKVVDAAVNTLVQLRSRLSDQPIQEAVGLLQRSRQILFAGLGASGHVAQDASQKFFRLGIPCRALTGTPDIVQCSAIAEPGDVLIVISTRGRWSELLQATEQATLRNVPVIALTHPESPLADAASLVFPCDVREDTNIYTPMNSRIAQLVLLDALQVALALAIGRDAERRLSRTKEALRDAAKRQGIPKEPPRND